MAKKHGPDCKEYFNCRSTREFRAHIRRSTDLSRAQQGGLLAFSETKNKEACRDGRGLGTVGWMHRAGLILVWRAVKNLMRGVTAHVHRPLSWLLRFLREIKIQRRDSSPPYTYIYINWNIPGNRLRERGFQLSARLPWLIVISISLLPVEPNSIGEIKLVKSAHTRCVLKLWIISDRSVFWKGREK